MKLLGRQAETGALDQLLRDVSVGESRVLVLRGEAGVGKSALLGYLTERVERSQLATAVAVESEMELAYSGLHQLCAPLLDHLEHLPVPQRDALATVFGLGEGPPPGRFLVGLATLTLFAEVAEEQSLVCVVEDAQWLDIVSTQILGFVARRLLAERIAIVCAARTGMGDEVLAGLPELVVGTLGESDARALLLENLVGPLDAAVCDQIVAESHGNPLALLELPRTWSAAELAGGFRVPESHPLAGKIEESYVRRLHQLPSETQLLVLAATAEPLGDPVLLNAAAKNLELDISAVDPAVDAGLLTVGQRVEFAHPLVRSSAYRSAPAQDRRRVHRALADATDAEADPDRRAWHRARATAGPDEDVAAELERSAGRAQARGGVAATAAFLQRAVVLSVDATRRAERALAAAQVSLQAGAFDATLGLLATAETGPLDEFQRAQVDLVRAHVAYASGQDSAAPQLLLQAARQLEQFDMELARETYLLAWSSAGFAGRLDTRDVLLEICRSVRALPPPGAPSPLDLLLDGQALLMTDGFAAAAPTLQRAAKVLISIPTQDVLRWGWLAYSASVATWDVEGMHAIAARHARLARAAGAIAELPIFLYGLALTTVLTGDFGGAASLIAEAESVAAATGSRSDPSVAVLLAGMRGREAEAAAIEQAAAGGQEAAASFADWAAAILYNGLARYPEAVAAARLAASDTVWPWPSIWALPELIEAAARAGDADPAREALERFTKMTQPFDTDAALGLEARCRALLSSDADAEPLYREAIDRLSPTQLRPELARAQLLYGEWLRRKGRRVDAREHLRTAHELCTAIGMDAFAERARRELLATGEKARKRSPETRDELTPQEEQIARLARDGFSNPEIGAQLFISPRTVEWHLRKVFTKLGITSRRQLRTALPAEVRFAERI
jgi:DNA-binding CsgD family transcriptional regulator